MQSESMEVEETPHYSNNEKRMSSLDDLVEAARQMSKEVKKFFADAQSLPEQQQDFVLQ